jgi:Cyanobacterial and plant NDH-1 subunit O
MQIKQSRNLRGKFMAVKKGDMVRAIREKLENSLEAKASDTRFPPYLFETKGEIVDVKGDYALIKFGKVPTPNVWLRVDQLEEFK